MQWQDCGVFFVSKRSGDPRVTAWLIYADVTSVFPVTLAVTALSLASLTEESSQTIDVKYIEVGLYFEA